MYVIKLKNEDNGIFVLRKNTSWFYRPDLIILDELSSFYKYKGPATKGLNQAARHHENIKIEDFEIREIKLTLI